MLFLLSTWDTLMCSMVLGVILFCIVDVRLFLLAKSGQKSGQIQDKIHLLSGVYGGRVETRRETDKERIQNIESLSLV